MDCEQPAGDVLKVRANRRSMAQDVCIFADSRSQRHQRDGLAAVASMRSGVLSRIGA